MKGEQILEIVNETIKYLQAKNITYITNIKVSKKDIEIMYNNTDEIMFIPTDVILYIIELKKKYEMALKTKLNKVYGRR